MNDRLLFRFFYTCLLGCALSCSTANADLVGTEEAATPTQSVSDRERLREILERPEVIQKLQTLGVPPEDAEARVRAMSDEEVRALVGRLDTAPAGGRMTDFQIVVVILLAIIILLILL